MGVTGRKSGVEVEIRFWPSAVIVAEAASGPKRSFRILESGHWFPSAALDCGTFIVVGLTAWSKSIAS